MDGANSVSAGGLRCLASTIFVIVGHWHREKIIRARRKLLGVKKRQESPSNRPRC